MQLIGIDFSGDFRRWAEGTNNSNVWIASAAYEHDEIAVRQLVRVQNLNFPGHPFKRLCTLISATKGARIAIDAPFSIPRRFLHVAPEVAWSQVAGLPRGDRPFPTSTLFLQLFCPDSPGGLGFHTWRNTEQYWRDRNVKV